MATKKARTPRSLRASENFSTSASASGLLFENNPLPMWVYDLETLRFLAVNDAAVTRYGYSRDEFLAMTIKDIRPPEDVPALLANVAQVADGLDYAGVWRHRKRDGALMEVEVVSHALTFGGRRAELVLVRDVTARRETVRSLAESEKRYRTLFDLESDAIFMIDNETGRLLEANTAASAMYGYSRDALLGMRNSDLSAEPEETRRVSTQTPIAPDRTVRIPLRYHRRRDGSVFPVEITGRFFEWQGRPVHIATIRDITDRHDAERTLRENERRLRIITDNMADTITEVDANRMIVYASPSVQRVFGYPPGELIGRPATEYIHPDDLSRLMDAVQAARARQESSVRFEYRYRHAAGHYLWVETVGQLLCAPEGGVAGAIYASRDITERKRAERALRESEERFRILAEASFEGIAFTEQGRFIDLNDQLARMLGGSREEFIGRPVLESVAPASRAQVAAAMAQEPLEPYEHLALRRDGSVFPVEIRVRSVSVGGQRLRVTAVRDITERKRIEGELLASREQYRALFEEATDSVFVHELSEDGLPGRFIALNDATCRRLGYSRAELLSMEVRDIDAPDSAVDPRKITAELQAGGSVLFEQVHVARDGRRIPVEIHAQRITLQGRSVILSMARDITDRRRAEEALRRSETRYRMFSELTSDYVYSCTRLPGEPFRVDWAGGAFERISGHPIAHLLRLGCWLPMVHPEDRERVERYLLELSPGQIGSCEFRLLAADGNIRWIRETSRCAPHEDHPGWLRLFGTSRDITESKRIEEEQRRFEEQMRHVQKLESLGVMAGGVAHDFNNLLMAILGNAELALTVLPPEAPARDRIREIETASRRAADLCQQMLAYSGKGRFVVEKLDLSAVVREMAHILQVSVSKKAALRYQFGEKLPVIEADATQVRQIIMNLLTNASEALGQETGVITLTTGSMICDRAYLAASTLGAENPEGRYVFLEVTDTGCGMDPQTIPRIFDPFFTTKFTGRGLGLAAVLGIVRGHRGALRVYSEPGKGSAFKVLFPAVSGLPTMVIEQGVDAVGWRGTGAILLVDDEEMVRSTARNILEWLGFQVQSARDGHEALEIFRAQPDAFACVLLDLTMPRVSGEEAFREIKRIRPETPVILSSGYNQQDVTQRFVGRGLAGFVQKPYTIETLREALRRVLG